MDDDGKDLTLTRRELLIAGAASLAVTALPASLYAQSPADAPPVVTKVSFEVNGQLRNLELDARTTLLDALREHLHLTGSKKGCDHGQCGACTVIAGDRRILSCLTLAVMHQGDRITTIEGLGTPDHLHPMQAAFMKREGFKCCYRTPGLIFLAVVINGEIMTLIPSHPTSDLIAPSQLNGPQL